MGGQNLASVLQPDAQDPLSALERIVEALSAPDLASSCTERDTLDLHERFLRFGYVKLAGFLSGAALEVFRAEMSRLEEVSIRRRFDMPGYDTPRRLSVLGGRVIRQESPALASLYHHHAVRGCIETIVGRPIYSCRHRDEFMVANFLQAAGDTHGWHLDDPGVALVIFAESPDETEGGEAEVIANWTDLCRRRARTPEKDVTDLIAWAWDNKLVDRHRHEVGDAYLLRADLNLHRVAPLRCSTARRSVLNLAFETSRNVSYGDTASLLYGRVAARGDFT